MWPLMFQWSPNPHKWGKSDSPLKTDKRAEDGFGEESNESVSINLEDFIHNILSQKYPEALKFKEEINEDVRKMLKQILWSW